MTFRKYDHIERLGHEYVEGIEIGQIYIFAKLDGTNASIWMEPLSKLCAGSRNRKLSLEADNSGFHAWTMEHANMFMLLFANHPEWRIYGEWLVPHTLKTYRSDVWRRFWVFDVHDGNKYVHYNDYAPILQDLGIDIIEPLAIITNPSEEQLRREVEKNFYLINDGQGLGEGIVIKNYDWKNQWDNQPWAKIVRNEFKEENAREFGVRERDGEFQVEAVIAEEYVTEYLVSKTRAKIETKLLGEIHDFVNGISYDDIQQHLTKNRGRLIPQLLETVFHDLVNEEIWTALKKYKFPTIDFKKLRQHCIARTKKHAAELF